MRLTIPGELTKILAQLVDKQTPPAIRRGKINSYNGDGSYQVLPDGGSVVWPFVLNSTSTSYLIGTEVVVQFANNQLYIVGKDAN